ncbi:hypothetical protein ACQY0O_006975 [Thecaphora frezii]
MWFRPLNAVLVAASIYRGGLGAVSAPMNFGNERSSAFTHFGRSASNTANDGAWASGGGLQHSQMLYYESFGMLLPDTQDALRQGPGSWNADHDASFLGPYAAQLHRTGYGDMHAYPLNTYGIPRYSQHSDLSIESAPRLHQQQGEFGDPGIPS